MPQWSVMFFIKPPALAMLGEGNGDPLQYSCLENPIDGGAWLAAVHGVAKSRTLPNDFTFTFHFHALENEMATHSSVLAWRIPGTGEPGGLPSMGSHRVGHDWSALAAAAAAAGPSTVTISVTWRIKPMLQNPVCYNLWITRQQKNNILKCTKVLFSSDVFTCTAPDI